MSEKILTLELLKENYGVCRLDNTASIPEWAKNSEFFSITKTQDELSIVCLQADIPHDIKHEAAWRILKIQGPLDFSLIGVLSKISSTLAKKEISIFAISTYDTDYILVKDEEINNTIEALRCENYKILV